MIRLHWVPPAPEESRQDYGRRLREEAHWLRDAVLKEMGFSPGPEFFEKGPYGKPYLKGSSIQFNLTHCRGLAAFAIGKRECGIDAESFERKPGAAIRRACSPEEMAYLERSADPDFAFFRLWTLKEAFIKATGQGLSFPLAEAAFSPGEGDNLYFCQGGYLFRQCAAEKHIISLCVREKGLSPQPIVLEQAEKLVQFDF